MLRAADSPLESLVYLLAFFFFFFFAVELAGRATCGVQFQAALQDLRTNGKIAPVLPYFINFVANGVSD